MLQQDDEESMSEIFGNIFLWPRDQVTGLTLRMMVAAVLRMKQ